MEAITLSPIERKHRLSEGYYRGFVNCAFTACIRQRMRPFTDRGNVDPLIELLAAAAARYKCIVPIYCFMPDHVHLILSGASEHADLKAAMDKFKYLSGHWLSQNGNARWQKNYYDHIISSSKDWRGHAFYIACNPVRAGLTQDPFAYPFTGSIGLDLGEVLLDASM